MTYSELFEAFWHRYGSGDPDFDATQKGPKTKANEAWKKAVKRIGGTEESAAQTITHGYSLLAQNRKNARHAKKWVARLPMLTTWLNQDRWSMDVDAPSSSYAEEERKEKKCACGGDFYGRSETGGIICKKCHLQEWYEAVKKTTDTVLVRWTPRMMQERYPRTDGESWVDWSRRVSKQIIREAKGPMFNYKPPSRQDCPPDEEYFRDWAGVPKMRRSDL